MFKLALVLNWMRLSVVVSLLFLHLLQMKLRTEIVGISFWNGEATNKTSLGIYKMFVFVV